MDIKIKMRQRSQRSLRREHRNAGRDVQKTFLGWHQPLLHSAIEYLVPHYARGSNWDMDHVYLVLPSSLAARRLQQLMAQTAAERSMLLRPPQIITFGDLPERLYKAQFPFASELQQTLAWIDALKCMTATELEPLLLQPPAADQHRPWMELATMLAQLHRELSSDLTMFSDVIDFLADDADAKRWNVLAKLQNGYLDRLSEQKLWDIQTARRVAIEKNEVSLAPGQEIVLLGTVDLNRAQRYFIDIVGKAVTVLIGAPENWQEGFDDYGALRGSFWQDICINIEEDELLTHSSANEVGETVARVVAEWSHTYSSQQITVGAPEAELLPVITERLARSGVRTRLAAGVPISQTSPIRLLNAIAEFLTSGSYESFAALIRLPAVERIICSHADVPRDYLGRIDCYYSQTILSSVRLADFPPKESETFLQVLAIVDEWLRPLFGDTRTLQKWAPAILGVIRSAFENEQVNVEDVNESRLYEACVLISQTITQFRDLPDHLTTEVTLGEAIAWIERELEPERIAPPPDADTIELLGWLELSLDDAPALVLTGVHDGVVPESVNSDPFLPNEIRTRLGLLDNARRYARDCYAMQVILNSREQLKVITNHHSSDGTPLTPSRLLLAVQPDQLATRITRILKPHADESRPTVKKTWHPRVGQTEIPIPKPKSELGKTKTSFSATDLADYLYCPYRFYLKKFCRLKQFNDNSRELEANTFGDLIHNCVAKLKGSPVESSSDAVELRKWLFNVLNLDALALFGKQPSPAVHLQIEQARLRLAAFAEKQAERARQGWQIWATEIAVELKHKVTMRVDDTLVHFHGRIDRIDYHPERDEYAIWDYKTSDSVKKPVSAHLSQGNWKQLQLPLYRHLAKGLKIEQVASVGYITLPKSMDGVEFHPANFTPEQYDEADEKIREVVSHVLKGHFWPPNYDDIFPSDEFISITQQNVARRWEPPLVPKKIATKEIKERHEEFPLFDLITSSKANHLVVPRKRHALKPPERIELLLDDTTGPFAEHWYSSVVIRASAGSGKTYQLASRVIQLLFAGEPTDSILATTFTRKAAGEILERVLTVVADAILDKEALKRLQLMVKPRKISVQGCKHHLMRLCSDLHRLRISTLDGFYSELAKNFSLELALPPGWTLADPFAENALRVQAINRMFAVIDREQLRSLISQLCKGEAVRGVWREIANTIEAAYGIYRVSPRSAWETHFQVRRPDPQAIQDAIEHIQASMCKDSRYEGSKQKLLDAFHTNDTAAFIASSLYKNAFEGNLVYQRKPVEPDVSQEILLLSDELVAHEFEGLEIQNKAAYDLLANYHQQLERVKYTNRVLTFDDVSQRLANWMRRKLDDGQPVHAGEDKPRQADMRPFSQRLDSKIKHLLLDEFQDTSPTQWAILEPFAVDVFFDAQKKNQKSSVFCVGDMKQAIYGWRGGVAELFDVISTQLKGIGEEQLSKSYRSSPVIIQFVNDTFTRLDMHEKYGAGADAIVFWMHQFQMHATERTALPGYVRLFNCNARQGRVVEEGSEEESTDRSQFTQCVADILELHTRAPHVSIGVLLRTNEEVTQVINYLREVKIDASQEGGNPLTDSAAVDLIMSVIAAADHPGDGIADFQIRTSPLLPYLYEEQDTVETLSARIRQAIDRGGYAETISTLADCLASACNERDQLRLEQLIQLAYQFEGLPSVRLKDFLSYVSTQKVSLPKPAAVRVMTIHQAKGLEFDAVFLPNLSRNFAQGRSQFVVKAADATAAPDGVTRNISSSLQELLSDDWKLAFKRDAMTKLQESICNFYVAITRARQGLYIYLTPNKNMVQSWESALLSIFAGEQRNSENVLVYEDGDPQWATVQANLASLPAKFESEESEKIEVALDFTELGAVTEARYLPRLRPSEHVEQAVVDLERAFQKTATVGAVVGTMVHRWFEDIEWITDYKFDRKKAREQALDVLTPEQMPLVDIDEWIDKFESYLEIPSVRCTLSKDKYHLEKVEAKVGRKLELEIQNERRLLEYVDGTLLRGTIDRLVLVKDKDLVVAAEIVDYKTDFLEVRNDSDDLDAWIESRKQRHGRQLRLYRDAIARQYALDKSKIIMSLMLLSAGRVVVLDS